MPARLAILYLRPKGPICKSHPALDGSMNWSGEVSGLIKKHEGHGPGAAPDEKGVALRAARLFSARIDEGQRKIQSSITEIGFTF